jgi:hypothetical protein
MKRSIFFLIFIFSVLKLGLTQDLIIRKTGETISCKITNVDSTKIMFDFEKNGEIISAIISKEEISDYKYGYMLKKASHWWLDAGLGVCKVNGGGEYDKYKGLTSLGINFSYQINKGLILFHCIYNVEFGVFLPSPLESVWDFGAFYGRFAKTSYGFASVSGGVSYVGGVRQGRYLRTEGFSNIYEKLTFNTVGIPIEGQLFWTPTSHFGIGIYGFANMNPEKSLFGCLLCIKIGKLR